MGIKPSQIPELSNLTFKGWLDFHGHLQKAKNVLVNTLNQHEGGLEHHISGNRTDPEGFVFHPTKTKDTDGSPIKLVNRAEFSRANLLKVR